MRLRELGTHVRPRSEEHGRTFGSDLLRSATATFAATLTATFATLARAVSLTVTAATATFVELCRASALVGVEHGFDLRAGLLTKRAMRLAILRAATERLVTFTRLLEDATHLRDLVRSERELLRHALHTTVEVLAVSRLAERLRALPLLRREDRVDPGAHRLACGLPLLAGFFAPRLAVRALLREHAAELFHLRGRELKLLGHVLEAGFRAAMASVTTPTVMSVRAALAASFRDARVSTGDSSILSEGGKSGDERESGSEDEVLHGDFLSRP